MTFDFFSETCVLGHKQGKIRQKLETPLNLCYPSSINLKLCTDSYTPIIHCLEQLRCLDYQYCFSYLTICDFQTFYLRVNTCTNNYMLCSSFPQISTLKMLITVDSNLIPLISLIPTSKDVFYPTHHVYSLGLSFYSFISLLSTLLPKLAFWTLFRAKHFYLYLAHPYPLMNYL